MYGGDPPQIMKSMKKALLGLVALPLTIFTGTGEAMAYGLGGWGSYGSYPSTFSINGPGNYRGTYNRLGSFHTYRDNYGSTTCSQLGTYIKCF